MREKEKERRERERREREEKEREKGETETETDRQNKRIFPLNRRNALYVRPASFRYIGSVA